jgi:hypothetical protein
MPKPRGMIKKAWSAPPASLLHLRMKRTRTHTSNGGRRIPLRPIPVRSFLPRLVQAPHPDRSRRPEPRARRHQAHRLIQLCRQREAVPKENLEARPKDKITRRLGHLPRLLRRSQQIKIAAKRLRQAQVQAHSNSRVSSNKRKLSLPRVQGHRIYHPREQGELVH